MEALLIISEEGILLSSERTHSLGKILNRVTIPTLPYALPVFSLVKLSYISNVEQYLVHIETHDPRGQIIQSTEKIMVHNLRNDDEVPGVDLSFNHQLVLSACGVYTFCLFINGELKCKYPLGIRLEEM